MRSVSVFFLLGLMAFPAYAETKLILDYGVKLDKPCEAALAKEKRQRHDLGKAARAIPPECALAPPKKKK